MWDLIRKIILPRGGVGDDGIGDFGKTVFINFSNILFLLYFNISLICLFLALIHFAMVRFNIGKSPDVWKMLNKLRDVIESIQNETIKGLLTTLIESMIAFPINALIFNIVICFIPLLNILVLVSNMQMIKERFD